MEFNTERFKKGVEQIASVLSDLLTTYVEEAEVGIGEIEQGMRQILQEVGRHALGRVLAKSDQPE